ncbi:unnamed protein product [Linum tenue]|uniref:S-protein homolog n=1 Tax=Linum tenue TaxID=586396 RepID=A0AAV0NJT1_9ROSI|nr:unnamed protein product [Linum tenue]
MLTRVAVAIALSLVAAVAKAEDGEVEPAGFLPKKTTVTITNRLESQVELTVHCKSKDDDIGVKVLSYNQEFGFHFRANIFFTTRFYGSFEWPDGGGIHWFDIYKQNRDYSVCKDCQWIVKSLSPCRFNDVTKAYDVCYEWNKSKV